MHILVLGGTRFLGRYLVERAAQQGHRVTLFNRGRLNPDLFRSMEALRGDRENDLSALQGRRFDVVFDTSAYLPRVAQMTARLLKDSVGLYVFVSSTAVYADPSAANPEIDTRVARLSNPAAEEINGYTYGPLKALCEEVIEKEMPGRSLHVRAGVMAGPFDYSDRVTYWPHRFMTGGDVLLPDCRKRRIQLIDGRDLAGWMLAAAERGCAGTFNATGPEAPLTFEAFINSCVSESGGKPRLCWIDERTLLELDVRPWVELPLWIPDTDDQVDTSRARAEGLRCRPLGETLRDTVAWLKQRQEPFSYLNGLRPAREISLLKQVAA
jgi:2'-hydroxyisoflavone reductase